MAPLPVEKRYTYADLLAWDEDTRYELYDGIPVALASPSDSHQRVLTALLLQLGNYLEGKRCNVYPAPFDVRLFQDEKDRPEDVGTVVQPDLMVVCDRNKVDRHGVHGAPDLVIEILSDSTRRADRLTKFNLYQRAGVWEYWIADPDNESVQVFTLDSGALKLREDYGSEDVAKVNVLDGCFIELNKVFSE